MMKGNKAKPKKKKKNTFAKATVQNISIAMGEEEGMEKKIA